MSGGLGVGGGSGPGGRMPAGAVSAAAASGGSSAAGRVLDFRRGPTQPRRRKRSFVVSLVKPLSLALVLVALPCGLVAWVLTSRRFELREVTVDGATARVSALWVRQALQPLTGQNLVRLSLDGAAARLTENPWVETVELGKELPGRLHVALSERRPAVLLLAAGRLVYADAAGRPIAAIASPAEEQEARRSGLLTVGFEPPAGPPEEGVAGALRVAQQVKRVRPDWAAALTRIDVLGEEGYRLHAAAVLPCPLLVADGQVEPMLTRLPKLLPELARRYSGITGIDLRSGRRIVVQPVLGPAKSGGAGV